MFLRTRQFSTTICAGVEKFRAMSQLGFGTNLISKRYAGHSQYANRKASKKAGAEKRVNLLNKYQIEIKNEIRKSKNANLATNSKLQAIFGEAMRNNIARASLENTVRAAEAALGGNHINAFAYSNPLGIVGIVEVSTMHPEQAKSALTSMIKKFGFQHMRPGDMAIQTVGIITCKPLENVANPLDKGLEDGILANCEEVQETDDNYLEFQCDQDQVDSCSKKLKELGYTIENTETRYIFPELIKIDDEMILEGLNKMEQKLSAYMGFIRVLYNIE